MLINTMNPYWWAALPTSAPVNDIPRIDICGIYKLSTNAVSLTDNTVDYGINPCLFNRLPNECIVLLRVHADVPEGGAALPAALIIPNQGSSTVATQGSNTTTGTSRVSIVDSQGTPITGANMQGNTERLAYINKCSGTIRFLEFTNATA